jgi:hypothetical protein
VQPAAKSRLISVLRVLAAVSVLVSFASLWLSERTRVLDDLQLAAEATARPGESVALRAFYLRDVDAPRGPELARAEVQVRLLDAHEREVGRTTLRPGQGDPSMEGRITLPSAGHGSLTLEARAQLQDRAPIVCRRAIDLRADAPTLVPRAREAAPLSLLSLGTLRPLEGSDALPARLDARGMRLEPRVIGGTCVPEQPCRVLVWLGGRAMLRVRHDAALVLGSIDPPAEHEGFVAISLRVLGPEATLVLEALRDGQPIAERSMRVPVALGEAQLSTPRALLDQARDLSLAVLLPPGRTHGIVDFFAAGRWSTTQAFVGDAGKMANVPLAPAAFLRPGLTRIQAHADRFAGEGAGTRLVYLRAADESVVHALHQIAGALRAAGFDSLPLGNGDQLPAGVNPALVAEFLLASLEGLRVPLPRAVSGRPPELARLSRAQAALRFGVGGMLTLSALVVGLTLMRRGFSAEAEARAILGEARDSVQEQDEEAAQMRGSADAQNGDEADELRNNAPATGVLVVVCLALAVGLAFVLAALLIVAKPLWF